MRRTVVVIVLFAALASCRSSPDTAAEPSKAPLISESAEVSAAEPADEPELPSAGRWSELSAAHDDALLGLSRGEMHSANYRVSERELVVFFEFPMVREPSAPDSPAAGFPVIRPSRLLDYDGLAEKLGAQKVGGVPEDFKLRCGTNHGGDFDASGARYGIYVSGGCHHVRIMDVTPAAVRMLLGEEFVSLLDACNFEIGPACRTDTEVRIKVSPKPSGAAIRVGYRGTSLEWSDGWVAGQVPKWAREQPFDGIGLRSPEKIGCSYSFPELSPPEACGLAGEPFRPGDLCKFGDECRIEGRCETVEGACRATDERACERSRECFMSGRCVLQDGACVATAAHCKSWKQCALNGRCELVDGACTVSDASCRASTRCRRSGKCSAVDGRCQAASQQDCAQSEGCVSSGRCDLRGGNCTDY